MRWTSGVIVLVAAMAIATDGLAREAVPVAYRQVASEFGIPPDLLYAMALAESGRVAVDEGEQRPWPWTLNIAGEGRFFNSRMEAWRALDRSLGEGEQRIDVGLMQIHWRYHRTLLKSSWLALEPHRNLQLAAGILAECYQKRREWWASVGCYHAPGNDRLARKYRERVLSHWRDVRGPE